MAANTSPIWTRTPDVQWGVGLTTANTNYDGTGSNQLDVFTADATEGGYVQKLRIKPLGSNVATVIRIFLNNGSAKSTAANNALIDEIAVATTTGSTSSPLTTFDVPLNFALKAGYVIFCTTTTSVASGFAVAAIGGKY